MSLNIITGIVISAAPCSFYQEFHGSQNSRFGERKYTRLPGVLVALFTRFPIHVQISSTFEAGCLSNTLARVPQSRIGILVTVGTL